MPRRVTSRIHDYFIFDTDKSICQLINKEGYLCNTAIKGKHAGNLEKHVKTWHEEEWKLYWNDKNQLLNISENVEELSTDSHPYATHFVNVDFQYLESETIEYNETPESKKRKLTSVVRSLKPSRIIDLENALVEMVTVNGLPFTIIEESGFKKLLSVAYGNSENTVHMSRNKLHKLVKTKAELIRNIISQTAHNKILSLRIDCAIVKKSHVFGIGVQFRDEGKLRAYHLAVVNLPQNHSQNALKEEIVNVLAEFEIELDQVYYVLVTNCSQALKIFNKCDDSDDLKLPAENIKTEYVECNGYDSDFDIFEVEETELDTEDEEHHEFISDEEVENDEATEKLVEDVIKSWSAEKHVITSKNFGYAFQLAVLDTFDENEETKCLLKKIRTIIKKTLSPTYQFQLKSLRCKKKPVLDSATRLLSSYDMLHRFMELKPYLDQLSASSADVNVTLNEWNSLIDIVDSLKPLKYATQRLSSKDLPLSEFYKIWITCFLKTKKIGTLFSSRLCKNMDKHKYWLFDNIAFKSCLFLDPRFKNTLAVKDHETVVQHLTNLNDRLTSRNSNLIEETTETASLCTIKLEHTGNQDDDDLYQYVQSMVKTPVKPRHTTSNLNAALKAFKDSEPLLDIQNVPAFWQEKKYLYADVYKLSQIILAVPVANAFLDVFVSQLKFLNNTPKANTDSRSFKDVLLVRSNYTEMAAC